MIETRRSNHEVGARGELPSKSSEFLAMAAAIHDVVYEWDVVEGTLHWNSAMRDAFGHSTGATRQSIDWWSSRVHEDDRARAIESLEDALDSGSSTWACEYRFRRADGSYATVFDRGYLIRDASGAPLRMLGSMVDLTDRLDAVEALRESEQRYRAIFEQSRDAIYVSTLEGRLVDVNPAAVDLLGYSRDELLSTDVREFYVDPAQRSHFQEEVRRTGFVRDFAVELRARDRSVRSCLLSSSVRRGPDGSPVGYQGVIHDITERKRVEQQLAYGALHDALTGLPNRALFHNRLTHAIARANRPPHLPFAVLLLDVDRFKVVNDSRGHVEGDRVLAAVAERIASTVRSGDTVARLGSDEFAVLLEPVESARVATHITERILHQLSEPFTLGGGETHLTVSAGIALGRNDTAGAEELLRNADTALTRAKTRGRACYDVFDLRVHAATLSRLEMEVDLRHALERDELYLVYQPIIEAGSGTISGLEALVRWRRADGSIVAPDQFIPIAEETGLIIPIGRWVLREACRYLRNYNDALSGPPLTMSVNLSGKQIAQPGLVQEVARVLREEGVEPSRLKLELTETALIEHASLAGDVFARLRDLGVELYMDDFGTGYSSLSHLHRFPLDALKIDRSFVNRIGHDERSMLLIRAIVALAKSLGVTVVAEGVESAEQLEGVRALGCEFAQGYWFSMPRTAADTLELLRTEPRW